MNQLNHVYIDDKRIAKEINLKEVFRIIKRRLWVVLLITIVVTVAGWFYSNLNKSSPLYESSANIIIGANAELRTTLQVIIKDTIVLDKVISELGLQQSPKALAGQINVESIDSSQVVKISVIDTNPERAAHIANTIANVFKLEIPNILEFEDVRILSSAKSNPIPINEDNRNKIIIAASIFGMITGFGLIFLIDALDDSIKSEREIERILGIQVIGNVSKINKKNKRNVKKKKKAELELRSETIGSK
ncbi:Wzz/FepE/Etk N-terminal domain-containing protein [Bacillus sp. FJAT-50079]|uniref:YveK family protein n=1 Tax=Bacillus sp. FJAT-50079 TaxID=2833577 RepID=UPI001BC8D95B|nr:Wzz/FepE/Etk N-terminal domain-containing protein [Bacillus sp. FJAT-50079]MBS4209169.1 capsular biosynthesis protein [Bacillus sp. FJAT-50079]